jgi:hypothetical protein
MVENTSKDSAAIAASARTLRMLLSLKQSAFAA